MICFLENAAFVAAQGDSLINQTDAHNLKQGYWEKKYPNGELMYQGYFENDVPVGEMKRFYESGALQAVLNYDGGGKYVSARLYYENGNMAAEGKYVNTVKDSIWKYYSYYDNTLALEESYSNGKRYGPMVYYYSNGLVSERIEWENDVRHGYWVQYFNDGTLKLKAAYAKSKLEGEFLVNHEDGTPYAEGTYLDDQRHGLWTFYDEDGGIDMELNYQNGTCLDEEKIVDQQQEFFRMIDENKGKFDEPDETEFLMPAGR
jgi:antitoxin component YwqK of YwqJK toxin-antitoxin module